VTKLESQFDHLTDDAKCNKFVNFLNKKLLSGELFNTQGSQPQEEDFIKSQKAAQEMMDALSKVEEALGQKVLTLINRTLRIDSFRSFLIFGIIF
jgi:hypothetical protein